MKKYFLFLAIFFIFQRVHPSLYNNQQENERIQKKEHKLQSQIYALENLHSEDDHLLAIFSLPARSFPKKYFKNVDKDTTEEKREKLVDQHEKRGLKSIEKEILADFSTQYNLSKNPNESIAAFHEKCLSSTHTNIDTTDIIRLDALVFIMNSQASQANQPDEEDHLKKLKEKYPKIFNQIKNIS